MYDENQQGPKHDQELIDLYGYDIRQEEGAPRYKNKTIFTISLNF